MSYNPQSGDSQRNSGASQSLSETTYAKCTRLAAAGLDFSHHIRCLDPDQAMRLKHFVLNLPEDVAKQTIYGRVVWKDKDSNSNKKNKS